MDTNRDLPSETESNCVNVTLSFNESIPFRVAYHEKEGESLCTVRQEDLENLYRAYRWKSKALLILAAIVIFFAILIIWISSVAIEPPVVYMQENAAPGPAGSASKIVASVLFDGA